VCERQNVVVLATSAFRSPNWENSASFVSALMKPTKSALLDPMMSGTCI